MRSGSLTTEVPNHDAFFHYKVTFLQVLWVLWDTDPVEEDSRMARTADDRVLMYRLGHC